MGTILVKALLSVGTKLLASLATRELLEWALFKVADVVVESTETAHDDEFIKELKKSYNEQ